jgi:hypothetical protein
MPRAGRRPAPRIVDWLQHPTECVPLVVAAEFLQMNPRTLAARIEAGQLSAWRDGRVWRLRVTDLIVYRERHRTLA